MMTDDELRAAAARFEQLTEDLKSSMSPQAAKTVEALRHLAELPPVNPELAERMKAISEAIDRMRPRPQQVRQAIAKAAPAQRSRRIGWRELALPYMAKVWKSEPFGTVKAFYRALERKSSEPDSPFIRRNNELFLMGSGKPIALRTVQNNIKEIEQAAAKLHVL